MKRVLCSVVGIFLLTLSGLAQCPSQVCNAATAGLTDVRAAVTTAVNGDKVVLPPGSVSWTDVLTITKNISIQGAGDDQADATPDPTKATIINGPGNSKGQFINVTFTQTDDPINRISGLVLNATQAAANSGGEIVVNGTSYMHLVGGIVKGGCRVDHIRFTATSDTPSSPTIGKNSFLMNWCPNITGGYVNGSFDHNFVDYIPQTGGSEIMQFASSGSPTGATPNAFGEYTWGQDYTYGGGLVTNGVNDAIYIEDNVFHRSGVIVDAEAGGGRLIMRHNTSWGTLGTHGFESGGNMGPFASEIYNNVITGNVQQTPPLYSAMIFRGGSFVSFYNRCTGYTTTGSGRNPWQLALFRLSASPGMGGPADGTNFFDENWRGNQTFNSQSFTAITNPSDTRIGSVYAQSSGSSPYSVEVTAGQKYTLNGLDGASAANMYVGFVIRNLTYAIPEVNGGQGQTTTAQNLSYAFITSSTQTNPTTVTIQVGANIPTPWHFLSATGADQWELRRVKTPFCAPGAYKLVTQLNGGSNKNPPPVLLYVSGSPNPRWDGQTGFGIWQTGNLMRTTATTTWANASNVPNLSTSVVSYIVPGGTHDGALPTGYPTQANDASHLRIGANWDAPGYTEAIQQGQDGSPSQAYGGPYPAPDIGGTLNPPVINSSLTASATVGNSFSYTITATNTPTTFSIDPTNPLPSSFSLNSSTGVITSSSVSGQPSIYSIGLRAANGDGVGSATLVLTISGTTSIPRGQKSTKRISVGARRN